MEILILLILISLVLVGCAVAFFAWTLRERTYDHSDRLSLLPLVDSERPADPHRTIGNAD